MNASHIRTSHVTHTPKSRAHSHMSVAHSHMYRHIHICTDAFTYVQIHSHTYRYIHICTDTFTYVQIHSHMYRYIIIQADLTGAENGLSRKPLLGILLRGRGGMRGVIRGSTHGPSGIRGRASRPLEGREKKMGGSPMDESSQGPTSPPGRGGRGRGRGNYSNETRRPTLIHTAEQEPIDANIFNASLKATQELHRSMMTQHCLRSWEDFELQIGHRPSPVMAERTEEKREDTSKQGTLLASNIRVTSTGPIVVKTEQPTMIPTLPVMITAKPSPKHPQDTNISSSAAGTATNQHSPPPQQSRGEGRDQVKKSLTFATPSRSKLTVPTPGDNRGTSRDTSGMGAKKTTKGTVTPPTPDPVDTDRPSSTGGEGLSHRKRMSKADLPVQTPQGTDSQAQERGKEHK